ncbi:MAG: hypothetical protein KJ721_02315 [Nanoarchaeota archaeon]|nr:hypothetical protein [Nanoarchaeota archaeon]
MNNQMAYHGHDSTVVEPQEPQREARYSKSMRCLRGKKITKRKDENRKIYKVLIAGRNTNRFVGFMLPGNPRRLPDDFYFSKLSGGLKDGGNLNVRG